MSFVFSGMDFNQARQELEDYIQSLPEASRWKDFIETSTGSHILDLLAGLGVYLRHSVGIARREVYVSSARLYNSLVAIANTYAYPVNRPNALVLEIDLVPNQTTGWNKEVPIGNLGGAPLSLTTDVSFTAGVPITIQVAVGQWMSESFTTGSSSFQKFFISGTIDNFVYQLIDSSNNIVPIRRYLEDFDPNGVVEITAPGGVHLLSGEGRFACRFFGESYTFQWIEPVKGDFTGAPSLDLDATINNVSLVRSYSDGDTVEKLSVVVPGYHAARARAVTLRDYRYIIMSYQGSIVDGSATRGSTCCRLRITYLNTDDSVTFTGDWDAYLAARYTPLSNVEVQGLIDYIKDRGLVGILYDVEDPVVSVISVTGRLYVDPASDRDISDIRQDVENLFLSYRTDLGESFYIGEITALLGRIDGIERVYVDSPTSDQTGDWNEVFLVKPDFTIDYAS